MILIYHALINEWKGVDFAGQNTLAMHAELQSHSWSRGIPFGGVEDVEDGNPGLCVAELLNYSCPPGLFAFIPLCTVLTETSIAVGMNDPCLSSSLNLQWGVLC